MAISSVSAPVQPSAPIRPVQKPQAVGSAPQQAESAAKPQPALASTSGDKDGDSDNSGIGSTVDVRA